MHLPFNCLKALAAVAVLGVCASSAVAQSHLGKSRDEVLSMGLDNWIAFVKGTESWSKYNAPAKRTAEALAYTFYFEARFAANRSKWESRQGGVDSPAFKAYSYVYQTTIFFQDARSRAGYARQDAFREKALFADAWSVFLSKAHEPHTTNLQEALEKTVSSLVRDIVNVARNNNRDKDFLNRLARKLDWEVKIVEIQLEKLSAGERDFMLQVLLWALDNKNALPK